MSIGSTALSTCGPATSRRSRKGTAMSDAKQLVEQIAAEADATINDPMPEGTVWTRPGKTVTVATRVSPEPLAAIEDLDGIADALAPAEADINAGRTYSEDEIRAVRRAYTGAGDRRRRERHPRWRARTGRPGPGSHRRRDRACPTRHCWRQPQ